MITYDELYPLLPYLTDVAISKVNRVLERWAAGDVYIFSDLVEITSYHGSSVAERPATVDAIQRIIEKHSGIEASWRKLC